MYVDVKLLLEWFTKSNRSSNLYHRYLVRKVIVTVIKPIFLVSPITTIILK